MNNQITESLEKKPKDTYYSLAKIALSLIPHLGSATSECLDMAIGNPAKTRKVQFLISLSKYVEKL